MCSTTTNSNIESKLPIDKQYIKPKYDISLNYSVNNLFITLQRLAKSRKVPSTMDKTILNIKKCAMEKTVKQQLIDYRINYKHITELPSDMKIVRYIFKLTKNKSLVNNIVILFSIYKLYSSISEELKYTDLCIDI